MEGYTYHVGDSLKGYVRKVGESDVYNIVNKLAKGKLSLVNDCVKS